MINIGLDGVDTVALRTDDAQFNKRISLKSIIFNIEMDICDYIITFHKVPSRENFKKFVKAINEEYRLETYRAQYATTRIKDDIDIKEMYTTFNHKRLSKKKSKFFLNLKPMFGCLFFIQRSNKEKQKNISITLYRAEEQIYRLFKSIGIFDRAEEIVLVDFDNIDFWIK